MVLVKLLTCSCSASTVKSRRTELADMVSLILSMSLLSVIPNVLANLTIIATLAAPVKSLTSPLTVTEVVIDVIDGPLPPTELLP